MKHAPLILIGVTLLIFAKCLWFSMVQYDDPLLITQNPNMRPGDFSSLIDIWSKTYSFLYIPATLTTWWATVSVFGYSGSALHFMNLLFYLGTVVSVFYVLLFLSKNRLNAFLGALLFAVHPFHASSVGWISELKGVQGSFFLFTSLLVYLKGGYKWSLVLFLAALLAKPNTVVLLPLIVIIDWMILKRVRLSKWAGFAALAAPMILAMSSIQPRHYDSIGFRLSVALDALGFYVSKIVSLDYYVPIYWRTKSIVMHSELGFVGVAFILATLFVKRIRIAGLMVIVLMLPNSGLVPFTYQGHSIVADRYFFLSIFGVAYFVSTLRLSWMKCGALALIFVLYSAQSYRALSAWENSTTLCSYINEHTDGSKIICLNEVCVIRPGKN